MTPLLPFGIGLSIAVLSASGWLSRWQEQALDWQFRWRGNRQPPREIVLVSIDDDSLKQVGAWPWPRSVHAELVRKLSRAGAKAVVFDVMFAEPSADDAEFARVAKAAGNVFFAMYFARKERGMFASYAPTVRQSPVTSHQSSVATAGKRATDHWLLVTDHLSLPVAEGAVYPVRALREAAAGVGHVNVFPELDGVLRRSPLFIAHEGKAVPSLALAVADFGMRNADFGLKVARVPQSAIRPKGPGDNPQLPVDSHGELLLNFYGGYRTFPYYPAHKLLRTSSGSFGWDDRKLRETFANRVVLIGVTAGAAADLHATPFTPRCPGVEANCATALANLLRGDFIRPLPPALLFVFVMMSGALAGALPHWLRTRNSVIAVAALSTIIVALSHLLFCHFTLWLDFIAPMFAVVTAYSVGVLGSLRMQEVERIRAQEHAAFLQHLTEMKSEYVSYVSHELRTPLTAILGYAGTLQRDTQNLFDEKTKHEFYATMQHEARRLLRLINESLDIARLEAGRPLGINVEEVDAKQAITRAVATQQFYGKSARVFSLDVPADLPTVAADPDRLDQILLNLLSNAVKYSPDGGAVSIAAQLDTTHVVFRVQDEGLGIKCDQLSQLFQPYQRLDSAQAAKIGGTGLGLYLTKALVEAQGGRIWAESEGEGRGSEFRFSMPVSSVRVPPASQLR